MSCQNSGKTAISEQALALACRFSIIEAHLQCVTKPHMFFQLLKHFLHAISSQDPGIVHYEIARYTLAHLDKGKALQNELAIDLLARELLSSCHLLSKLLQMPVIVAKLIRQDESSNNPYITIIELPKSLSKLEELFFTDLGLTFWDSEYLKLLRAVGGPAGKKLAERLEQKLRNNEQKWDLLFWFKEQDLEHGIHFFHSPAFIGLASVLWEDLLERKMTRYTSEHL